MSNKISSNGESSQEEVPYLIKIQFEVDGVTLMGNFKLNRSVDIAKSDEIGNALNNQILSLVSQTFKGDISELNFDKIWKTREILTIRDYASVPHNESEIFNNQIISILKK